MYNRLILYPYKLESESATLLATTLKTKRVRSNGTYRYFNGHLIVNWGNSRLPIWATTAAMTNMLNKPQFVSIASDKIATFRQLQTVMPSVLPEWTTDINVAKGWLINPIYGKLINAVVCRELTRANSGRGIVLATTPEDVIPAPLYTRYKPKQIEFRIHVSSRFGFVDAQQKKRRNEVDDDKFNQYIRSHHNGWVFCRENIKVPDEIIAISEQALHALNLDFGAVDIGWHEKYGLSLFEINTAPGIEGQTLTNYVEMFRRYLHNV